MKIAITGASGHTGNCLVRELKNQGHIIKALVHNFMDGLEELDVELIKGDLLDPQSLDILCEGTEVVFHLAARIAIDNRSPGVVYSINVSGTENILRAAMKAGVKKFIHFSSIDAFQSGNHGQVINEDSSLINTRESIYRYSKAEGERLVLKAAVQGLHVVILNPTAIIGPFDFRNSLAGKALRDIYLNRLPFLVSGGYNWVDVRDVVSASIQAAKSGRTGERYIISGNFCSLRDLSFMIKKLSGCRIPLMVPVSLARLTCPFFQIFSSLTNTDPLYTNQSLDLLVSSPSNISFEKAYKELGYAPRPLEQTLENTFEWYKETGMI